MSEDKNEESYKSLYLGKSKDHIPNKNPRWFKVHQLARKIGICSGLYENNVRFTEQGFAFLHIQDYYSNLINEVGKAKTLLKQELLGNKT